MGLTIHWHLKYQGKLADVQHRLIKVGEIASQLGFTAYRGPWFLDYVVDFNNDKENILRAGRINQESYRWAKIQMQQTGDWVEQQHIPDPKCNMYVGYVIHLWAGSGCEPTNIGLVSVDGENWKGHGFTKTQYAEEFVKCHLKVIAILDACKALGILESVSDEGGYWETRKLEVLGENINGYTAMIAGLGKVLKKTFGEDNLVSAVDDCKNYVTVKKGGGRNVARQNKRLL